MMKLDTEDGGARPRRRGRLPEALVTDTRNYGDGYPKRRGSLPGIVGQVCPRALKNRGHVSC